MFIDSIKKHCVKYAYNILIITHQQNKLDQIFRDSNIITFKQPSGHQTLPPNIKHKLFYLSHLDFEFIYLDYDMYINTDLCYLWDRRKDQPFISTWHQPNIIGHTENKHQFMNSGLQIVSDNSFYNYSKIINLGYKMNFRFDVPGTDQALLHHYFEEIQYNYCHKDIGYEWNSCAGYGSVVKTQEGYDITYRNGLDNYSVKINHYWNEFKPWKINCPIFKQYEHDLR